jgi:hypothetical protein
MPTMCEDCKLSIPLTQSRCEECEKNYNASCCGACGQFFPTQEADTEGFHSADYCEEARFSCGSCGYQFDQNEGVTMEQGTFLEFICTPCFFQGEGDK